MKNFSAFGKVTRYLPTVNAQSVNFPSTCAAIIDAASQSAPGDPGFLRDNRELTDTLSPECSLSAAGVALFGSFLQLL
jgi:hypothetical protein